MDTAPKRLPLLQSYIEKWADLSPERAAMIQSEDGRTISYAQFVQMSELYALRLLAMGIRKGDRISTMLLTVPEHFFLMYACFKIGAVVAPIDMRLKEHEVVHDLDKIKPKAFFFLGQTPARDFRTVGATVQDNCPYVEHLVQFATSAEEEVLEGAISVADWLSPEKIQSIKTDQLLQQLLDECGRQLETRTSALIIYTTGTTGSPKPAVLCHENIIAQNDILAQGINFAHGEELRFIVNLPPSHVAGTSELPMTTWFLGGTAILLRRFDARLTLKAIQDYRATCLGMLPVQYRMVWALPDYKEYNLSTLRFAAYAGAAVDVPFLQQLASMAPAFGCGIGMTENAGFATFTPPGISVEEMAGQVGRAFPEIALVTVRNPMGADGTAGDEVPDDQSGEICYHPPIVFLGYYNMPEETAKTISKEGILYTGDMGYFKDIGNYRALYLEGRRKFMIKQKGYNVFPDEVAAFIAQHPKVAMVDVLGQPHRLFDEGIFAFVIPKQGVDCSAEELLSYCKGIASYKRPQHIEFWKEGAIFPLTSFGKVNKIEMNKLASEVVAQLRQEGKWDAGKERAE